MLSGRGRTHGGWDVLCNEMHPLRVTAEAAVIHAREDTQRHELGEAGRLGALSLSSRTSRSGNRCFFSIYFQVAFHLHQVEVDEVEGWWDKAGRAVLTLRDV